MIFPASSNLIDSTTVPPAVSNVTVYLVLGSSSEPQLITATTAKKEKTNNANFLNINSSLIFNSINYTIYKHFYQ